MKKKTISLLLVCFLVVIGSLVIGTKKGGEFGGADDQIEDAIKDTKADYKPWFSSIWEPPSGEIESLLFAVQAAVGAGFIGFYIGKKSNVKANNGASQKE